MEQHAGLSAGEVVEIDFGKGDRDGSRMLARFFGLAGDQEADLLANPRKYYAQAVDEILRLQTILRNAEEALHGPASAHHFDSTVKRTLPRTITVPAEEWRRLKEVERHIRGAT